MIVHLSTSSPHGSVVGLGQYEDTCGKELGVDVEGLDDEDFSSGKGGARAVLC